MWVYDTYSKKVRKNTDLLHMLEVGYCICRCIYIVVSKRDENIFA